MTARPTNVIIRTEYWIRYPASPTNRRLVRKSVVRNLRGQFVGVTNSTKEWKVS